jgi:hypothetical protein
MDKGARTATRHGKRLAEMLPGDLGYISPHEIRFVDNAPYDMDVYVNMSGKVYEDPWHIYNIVVSLNAEGTYSFDLSAALVGKCKWESQKSTKDGIEYANKHFGANFQPFNFADALKSMIAIGRRHGTLYGSDPAAMYS